MREESLGTPDNVGRVNGGSLDLDRELVNREKKEYLDQIAEEATAKINELLSEHGLELMEFKVVSTDKVGGIIDGEGWHSFNVAMLKNSKGESGSELQNLFDYLPGGDNPSRNDIEKIVNSLSSDPFSQEPTFSVQNPTIESLTKKTLEVIKKFKFISSEEAIEAIIKAYDEEIGLATATAN